MKFHGDPINLSTMSEKKDTKSQSSSDATKLKSAEKQAQLSEALRANLRRRKEQARGRKSADTEDGKS